MLPAGGIQGGLSPIDSLLPALALFPLSRLLPGFFALATLPLAFVGLGGLSIGRLVGLRGRFLHLANRPLSRRFLRSVVTEIPRQFSVLAERPVGSHGALEDDTRLGNGRGNDVRVVALLRRALNGRDCCRRPTPPARPSSTARRSPARRSPAKSDRFLAS